MADDALTIDGLAQQVGMTVRNVRAHQSRGLLPPPEVRGRTGYYGAEHVSRLELIKEMQAQGYNLAAIKNLLDAQPAGSGRELLGFTRALLAPFVDEDPEIVTAEELRTRFGVPPEGAPRIVRKLVKIGIVTELGDGQYEVASPMLVRAGEQVVALGIPVEAAVATLEKIHRNASSIADAFVALFIDHVMRPFEASGYDPAAWPHVREALDRLRPLAAEATLATFGLTMSQAAEQALAREFERVAKHQRDRR